MCQWTVGWSINDSIQIERRASIFKVNLGGLYHPVCARMRNGTIFLVARPLLEPRRGMRTRPTAFILMAITTGTKVSSYELTALPGKGGIG